MDFLEGLNPRQREAVAHGGGPLLILAGAGSGKTRVITHRIAHLVHAHGVPSYAIVAVTFTNKAADEMRERVARLLQGRYPVTGLVVSTFHSFCVRVLRRDGDPLAQIRPGFTRNFTIYDEDEQLGIVKAVFRHLGLTEKSFMQYRAALGRISHAKSHKLAPHEVSQQSRDQITSRLAVVYEQYEARLRQANALDFDDLLLEAVRLLAHSDPLRAAYNDRIQHLLIDEYQDTNRSQYELMRLLTERRHNVCVVGDEDQSIYSWRGADIRNILDFERDYPDAAVIRLEQNYRSTKNILESASALVAHNTERKGKWLWTEAQAGAKIGLYEAHDSENEALWIADTIERVAHRSPDERIAILYRTNFQSRQIEEALRRYGRKYQVVGGFSFYQRAEIKDVLAYVKLAVSPVDDMSLLRVINTPARGIGKTTTEQIEVYALENKMPVWTAIAQMLEQRSLPTRADAALRGFRGLVEELREAASKPVHELVRAAIERTGYQAMLKTDDSPDSEARLENLAELMNAALEAAERGEGVADFLDHAALVSESDTMDVRAQVSLLTLHNAKGLEFPVVFLAGLEDGLFPHIRSLDTPSLMEEERRLCYVGMTRAQKELYVSWARYRRRYGGGAAEASIPSRFLREIPPQFVDRMGVPKTAEVNLDADQILVRDTVRKNLYTGKSYNSIENIAEFFQSRGKTLVPPHPAAPPPASPVPPARRVSPPPRTQAGRIGSTIVHPTYGRGTVMRREGEGENAKLTVSFPGYGLKKIIAKFAGIKTEE